MEKPTSRERRLLQEYKKTLVLSPLLLEIGIGTLLGDASLQTQERGKTFRLAQSKNKHRESIFHLFDRWNEVKTILRQKTRNVEFSNNFSFPFTTTSTPFCG